MWPRSGFSYRGKSACTLVPVWALGHIRMYPRSGFWYQGSGKSKWGLSNGGLRPLSAICAQSSTIVHFCGLLGPFLRALS